MVGGNDNVNYLPQVYFAKINTNGTIASPWTATTSLPNARGLFDAVYQNGYVYAIGGYDGTSGSSTVYYAKLNPDGTIGSWRSSSNTLPQVRYYASTVIYNGYIYEIGGSNGTAQSTVYVTSTARTKIAGSLDLIGAGSQSVSDYQGSFGTGSTGGELTAGNTNIIGNLQVQGASSFGGALNTQGNLNVNGDSFINGNVYLNGTVFAQNVSGSGEAIRLGNDTSLCDINVAATAAIRNTSCTAGTGTLRGTFAADSSLRYKHNINDLKYGLADILQMRPITYQYNNGDGSTQIGLVAEELAQIAPELVQYDSLGRPDAVYYDRVGVVTLKGIQQLAAQTSTMQSQLETLSNQITSGSFSDINISGAITTTNLTVSGLATLSDLRVSRNSTFDGDITIGGHIVTAGNTITAEILPAAGQANTSKTNPQEPQVIVDGNDTAGTITIKTGDIGLSTGDLAKIIFSKNYSKVPRIILSGQDAKSVSSFIYPASKSTSEFVLRLDSLPDAGTTYTFDYFIVE
jgi:hypothetical protein